MNLKNNVERDLYDSFLYESAKAAAAFEKQMTSGQERQDPYYHYNVGAKAFKKAQENQAIMVTFYKNGELFQSGIRLSIVPGKTFRTMDLLCDYLTNKTKISYGVRYIFTLKGGPVLSLNELEHGHSYVISGVKGFHFLPYGQQDNMRRPVANNLATLVNGIKREDLKLLRPLSPQLKYNIYENRSNFALNPQSVQNGAVIPFKEGKIVTVINNKDTTLRSRVLLNLRNPRPFDLVVKDLGQAVRLENAKKMYTPEGHEVRSISQLRRELSGTDLFYLDTIRIKKRTLNRNKAQSLESLQNNAATRARNLRENVARDLVPNQENNFNGISRIDSAPDPLNSPHFASDINPSRRDMSSRLSDPSLDRMVGRLKTTGSASSLKTIETQTSPEMVREGRRDAKKQRRFEQEMLRLHRQELEEALREEERKAFRREQEERDRMERKRAEEEERSRKEKEREREKEKVKEMEMEMKMEKEKERQKQSQREQMSVGMESNRATLDAFKKSLVDESVIDNGQKSIGKLGKARRARGAEGRGVGGGGEEQQDRESASINHDYYNSESIGRGTGLLDTSRLQFDNYIQSSTENSLGFDPREGLPSERNKTAALSTRKPVKPKGGPGEVGDAPGPRLRQGLGQGEGEGSFFTRTERSNKVAPPDARAGAGAGAGVGVAGGIGIGRRRDEGIVNHKELLGAVTIDSHTAGFTPNPEDGLKLQQITETTSPRTSRTSPSRYMNNLKDGINIPDKNFQLKRVHGYHGDSVGNNLFLLTDDVLAYYVSATVVLWNPTHNYQTFYTEHTQDIQCMAVNSSRTMIASSQREVPGTDVTSPLSAEIRVWTPTDFHTLATLETHSLGKNLLALSFSPKKNLVMILILDEMVRIFLWDWHSDQIITSVEHVSDKDEIVFGAIFHPNEEDIMVTFGKKHLHLWQTREDRSSIEKRSAIKRPIEWQFQWVSEERPGVTSSSSSLVSFRHNLTSGSRRSITIWAPLQNEMGELDFIVREFKGHEKALSAVLVLPNSLVVTGDVDSMIKTWDVNDGQFRLLNAVKLPASSGAICSLTSAKAKLVDIDLDADEVYVGTSMNLILRGSALNATSLQIVLEGHALGVRCIAAHPLEPTFYTTSVDQKVIKWSDAAILWKAKIQVHCTALTVHPQGQVIAIGTSTGEIHVMAADDGQPISKLPVCKQVIGCLAYSPDGDLLAAGSQDTIMYLLPVSNNGLTYEKVSVLKGPHPVLTLQWSSDGQFILSAVNDNNYQELILWDLPNCRYMRGISSLADNVSWVNGTCSGSEDVRGIWDNQHMEKVVNLCCHCSPSGKYLVSGDDDGFIRLFAYPCSDPRVAFFERKQGSTGVADVRFLFDDQSLVTCNFEGVIFVWELVSVSVVGDSSGVAPVSVSRSDNFLE